MESIEVKKILEDALELQDIYVKGDGNQFEIIAIDACFKGLSRVKKQQLIYTPLMELIQKNDIHAVTIRTFTLEEWEQDKTLISL